MITDAILLILYKTILIVISPITSLADVTLPSGLSTAITTANGYISSVNAFIPVDTLLTIFGAILVVEVAALSYKLIMWILTKIPGISN